MKSKKAQEGIIVTVLLVLVAIAAVSAVAYFIANQVSSGVSEAELKSKNFEIYAEKAQIQNGFLKLTLSRGSSTENFTSLKIVMTSGGKSQTYNYNGYINSLETVDISIPLTGDFASAKSIATDIYPVINEKIASKTSNINAVPVDSLVKSHLVAYLPFDVDAKDYSGYSRDATALNGVLLNTAGGKVKGAYVFDGLDDRMTGITNVKLNSSLGFSISVWAKPNNFTNDPNSCSNGLITSTDGNVYFNGGWSISQCIYDKLGRVVFWLSSGSPTTQLVLSPTKSIWDGEWHQLAVTVLTSGKVIFYIDGIKEAETIAAPYGEVLTSNVLISTNQLGNTNTKYFNGSIDEVRIYDQELSATEIKSIYDATK